MGASWLGLSVVAVVLVLAVAIAVIYNRLVVQRNRVDNSWAQIDVQLKRRYDLIPNLVATVKGYVEHEAGVFERVAEARSSAMGAQGVGDQARAEGALSSAIRSLFAVAEAYPELKANGQFLDLQSQLADSENKIAYARQFYNDSVMTLNTLVQSIPTNIVAGTFGFGVRTYFEAGDDAVDAPQVRL